MRGSRVVGCTWEAEQGLQEGTGLPTLPRWEDDGPSLEALAWPDAVWHRACRAQLSAPISSPGTWLRCSCCRVPRRRRSRSCTCGWGSSRRWASSPLLPCSPAASDASPRAASTPPAATACSAWSWRSPQVPAPVPQLPSGAPAGWAGAAVWGTLGPGVRPMRGACLHPCRCPLLRAGLSQQASCAVTR